MANGEKEVREKEFWDNWEKRHKQRIEIAWRIAGWDLDEETGEPRQIFEYDRECDNS